MKKCARILLIALLLSLLIANTAFAEHGDPIGNCPTGFERHHFMEHEGHEHLHIGVTQDLNGDGWICVKHLSSGFHAHMDNLLPIR